jgi:uncharacterized membrane protein YdbT with pleckstrin-like domain
MVMSNHKVFDGQHEDENVIDVFRLHPVVMRKGLLALLVFWVIGLLPFSYYFDKTWALVVLITGVVLGVLAMFYSWIGWFFTLQIITDQRFIQIKQEGLFKRTVVDITLDKVQSVNYQVAGLQETLLGFGTIIVQTFVGDLIIKYIHHPAKVQAELTKTIKDNGYQYSGEEIQNQDTSVQEE